MRLLEVWWVILSHQGENQEKDPGFFPPPALNLSPPSLDLSPADNHTQQKQILPFFFFFLHLSFFFFLHLSSHLRQYVIRGSFEQGILITRRAPLGFWKPDHSPLSLCGVKSRCNSSKAILRAASIALIAAVSDCTYLKTILLIFPFTPCWVENASKGNSRRGTELNWTAPTLTCSGRQRARGLRAGSSHKHPWEKGRERLTTLPPAHLQIPVLVFLWSPRKEVPKTGRRIWKETVKRACALYGPPRIRPSFWQLSGWSCEHFTVSAHTKSKCRHSFKPSQHISFTPQRRYSYP